MNGPPRLSTVNAPATCNGSPVATYAAISASETSEAKVTAAAATACASRAGCPGRPDDAVAGVQHARASAHLLPPRHGDLGSQRLAEHLPVELEHGVAADDDPSKSGSSRTRETATSAALRRASSSTCSSGRMRASRA
jgi:hypothetical protein